MARQFLILVFLCMAARSGAQNKAYQGIGEVVNGDATRITWTDSVVEGDTILIEENFPLRDTTYTSHKLDERGNQISCSYYNEHDDMVMQVTNRYDAENKRTETVCRNGNGGLIWKRVYKYDAKGYPATTITYNSKDSITDVLDLKVKYRKGKYAYCFDKDGKHARTVRFTEDDKPMCSCDDKNEEHTASYYPEDKPDTVITYDSIGRKTMTVSIGMNGTWRAIVQYDINGNEIEEDDYNPAGEKIRMELKEYDDHGDLLVRTEKIGNYFSPGGFREKFSYDANGHKTTCTDYEWQGTGSDARYVLDGHTLYDSNDHDTEQTIYTDGKMSMRTTNAFDAKGDMLHNARYDKDTSIKEETFCRYEDFDTHGNWRKKITWGWKGDEASDNIPTVIYRDIAYRE